MSKDIAALSKAARQFLKTWNNEGKLQCLQHVTELASQPDGDEEIRIILQSLVDSLIVENDDKVSPEGLALFYQELVHQQPSPSTSPEHIPIHQILLEAISVTDDVLNDRVLALDVQAKDAAKQDPPTQRNEIEAARTRLASQRKLLVSFVKNLVMSSTLTLEQCSVNLDYTLLQELGIVRDAQGINKKEVRIRTGLIYRQTKVNLLREQSEGYSKFTIELCNHLPPPTAVDEVDSYAQQSTPDSNRNVLETLMNIAGYFDLDPTRLLDIIIDAFSTHVMTHFSFFIQLIRHFVETRAKLLPRSQGESMLLDNDEPSIESEFEKHLTAAEGVNPTLLSHDQLENPVAHLLGFKFTHYESNNQNVPQGLMFATALLIREGLISIYDLYNHLSPNGEGLSALRQRHEDEMKKRIRLARTTAADKDNALANAGVLSTLDDREFASRRPPIASQASIAPAGTPLKANKEPRIVEEVNQYRDLALALLSVGALRPALFILTREEWLISRYPQLADVLLSHLEYAITPTYRNLSSSLGDPMAVDIYSAARRRLDGNKTPRTKLTLTFPVPPATSDVKQVFFFPRWMDRIPPCSDANTLHCVITAYLKIIGVHAYRSLPLFIKLCRIARNECQGQDGDIHVQFWTDIVRLHFLPLMSMSKDNCLMGGEIWPLLQRLEASTRWAIYAEWLQSSYDKSLEMKLTKALVTREAKGVLRRLNSKNQGQSARALAKIAYHNPCVVFSIAISQVMSYDNLAEPLIEALRTLTPIGYDILTFCLLDAFSQSDRPRMKDDGTNVAHWLQSLAAFTANLCRRYSLIDPTPILQFVVHRLFVDSPLDAIILRELIAKMSGIEPLQILSDNQIMAMGGGPVLQIETVASESRGALQTKPLQRSSDKLLTALSNADLMLPMLLLLAQQCQQCVFKADTTDSVLKGVASTFDDLQGIFFQFITFLSLSPISQKASSMKIRNEFFEKMPSLAEIVTTYGIEPTTVLHMCRTPIQKKIVEHAVVESKPSKAPLPAKEEPSVEMEGSQPSQITSTKEAGQEDTTMQLDGEDVVKPWLPILQPWINDFESVIPEDVKSVMGAPFFVTFWQLTLFEIVPLTSYYKDHVNRLTKLAEDHNRLESASRLSSRDRVAWVDRKERLDLFKESLVKETQEHLIIFQATKKRLAHERLHWFNDKIQNHAQLVEYLIQYCFFPRALLSPMDADFTSQFIKIMHNLGTKGFWTILCYKKFFGEQLTSVVFSCTQNEARNFGRFLRGVLRDLAHWFKDETAFISDSKKASSFLPGMTKKAPKSYPPSESEMFTWDEYKKWLKKIHIKIGSAFAMCISDPESEFMHISNAILVLKEILPVFPLGAIQSSTGGLLDSALQGLLAREKRGDIKILATSYQGQLRMVKREWEAKPGESERSRNESSSVPNGQTLSQVPAAPRVNSPTIPAAPTAPRATSRHMPSSAPTTHPLPANPITSRSGENPNELKSAIERPPVVKRINRDITISQESGEAVTRAGANLPERNLSSKLPNEVAEATTSQTTRIGNIQSSNGPKDAPAGPRNPAPRGHRLSEDPSSRPPPSAIMPPPALGQMSSSQELRTSVLHHQHDRHRLSMNERDITTAEAAFSSDIRKGDNLRHMDSPRTESRQEERHPDRRPTREDRRVERRPTREEERERERDRRPERERERERESGRREREPANRAVASRTDSPHRGEDPSGRKRGRDPREEEPSDRTSKRPTRERDRDKEKDKDKEKERDRRERSGREREKEHRHRERRRERDDPNSANASPKDIDIKDRDGNKSGSTSLPAGPRSMNDDRRMLVNATEAARRDRERADTPPLSRSLGSNGPPPGGVSRSAGSRRETRDDRSFEDSSSAIGGSLAARLAESAASLPPRPAIDQSRENERSDRDGGRKRSIPERSQEEPTGSAPKRVKINRQFNRGMHD